MSEPSKTGDRAGECKHTNGVDMTDTNKERAEFEAWVRTQPGGTDYALKRRDFPDSERIGEYVNPSVNFAWKALSALAAKAPAAPTGWYALAADGMATLCVDRDDAEKTAAESEKEWPNCGPFRAVQLYTAPPQGAAKEE